MRSEQQTRRSRRAFLSRTARATLGAAALAALGAAAGGRSRAAAVAGPTGAAWAGRWPGWAWRAERRTIGRSVEGREVEVQRVGTGWIPVLVIGGIHTGQERFSADLAHDLAANLQVHAEDLPGSVQLHVIGNANPDGYVLGRRPNANWVNLNRNWDGPSWRPDACYAGEYASGGGAPLSEPETAAVAAYLEAVRPALTISYHARGSTVEDNNVWLAGEWGAVYAAVAGYTPVDAYVDYKCVAERGWSYDLTGQFLEAMRVRHLPAFDVELSDFTTTDWEPSRAGLLATLRAVERRLAPLREALMLSL